MLGEAFNQLDDDAKEALQNVQRDIGVDLKDNEDEDRQDGVDEEGKVRPAE